MPRVALRRDQYSNVIADTYTERSFLAEYDVNNNLIYAGFALPGSATNVATWQIRKMSYDASNNMLTLKWPQLDSKASTSYNFAWDSRAGYTYS